MKESAKPELARAFAVAIWVLTLALMLTFVPGDDGLRHVGLAFGAERSWGQVYPFSQFETFADYDPWGGYDLCLRALATAMAALPLDPLLQQFVVLKLLSLGFVALLLGLCLRRGRIAETVVDSPALFLAIVVTGAALAQSLFRMGAIRPFAFGTFLLIYSVGQRGALRGFLSSGALCFLYPYLAWMYTGPVIVAHLLRGSRSLALGSLAATLLALGLQPASMRGLVLELVRSDAVRAQLDIKITEFAPMAEQLPLLGLLLLIALWFVPQLPAAARRLRVEHIMVLLFVPISIKYMRYFVDVWLPLLFVAHGADILRLLRPRFEGLLARWRELLAPAASTPAPGSSAASTPGDKPAAPRTARTRRTFRAALVLCYAILGLSLLGRTALQHRELAENRTRLQGVPQGSLAITEFNLQYRLLYARPDLSLVPSCEIGFAREPIREAYLGYLNRGEVCPLAHATGADFLIEGRGHYLDPAAAACLRLQSEDDTLRIWRVTAE